MYSKLPNLVLGFHGCDKEIFDKIILSDNKLIKSTNSYDWLGHGAYFWENSYERAWNWASSNSKIKKAMVIGAVIDLGHCLNLTDYASTDILKRGYELLKFKCQNADIQLPKNRNIKGNTDVLLRDLDCAVIQQIHEYNKETKAEEYDSVRGVFVEGSPVYDGSGFCEKTHVQICVVNPNCIKGLFKPTSIDKGYKLP